MPASAAKRSSARALPGRSTISPTTRPVKPAVHDLKGVGGRIVDAEIGHEGVGDLGEAAAHDRKAIVEPLEGPHQRARAGGEDDLLGDLLEDLLRQPFEQRDPPDQRLGEVELAAHGVVGDPGDLVQAPGVPGQQLDDLVLDQRRVDVHHDEALGAAVQAAALHGHVHLLGRRLRGQLRPQRLGIGAGHGELDARHRIARQPFDPVDVGSARRDPAA